ncbi:MAG: hypothetical protein LQ339_007934 [Xanthoria mediterranea]|nr:MAG: hypothetical protein LQ339_007934 [Xanthoria mediterranea]
MFREEVLQLNFYRVHMAYFLITILISSLILWGSGLADDSKQYYGSNLEYIDALFICTSAMTSCGLATVNLNILTAFQQAVLAVLIIMGNVVTVSTSVVVIRRHFFRQKMADVVENSKAGRKLKKDIDEEANSFTSPKPTPSAEQKFGRKNLEKKNSTMASGNEQSGDSSDAIMRRRPQRGKPSSPHHERRHHHQRSRLLPCAVANVGNPYRFPLALSETWRAPSRDTTPLLFLRA